MEKIRLGIIGIGNMGSGHAQRIKAGNCPDFILSAVADINPARLEWAKNNLGEDVRRYNSAEDMLNSGEIDACIVAVPHYDHPKYVIECLKREIHVMCEKPAGVYTKQVREMNEESEKHPDVVFGMMFNQRTNCVYKKMRELVQSGEYGQIRRTNWIITDWYRPQAYFDSGSWRATWSGEGGGVLLNQAPHNLDLWQWICGMPSKISAHMKFGKWHDIEVEDDVTAYCEYPNGATGVFITTTGDAKGTNRFEIQLDKAKIVADYSGLTVDVFDMSEPEFSRTNENPFGSVGSHRLELNLDGQNPQHDGVLRAWGGAILRGEPLVAHGSEGIYGLTISNAIHLSAWLSKEIELSNFDEDLFYSELQKRVATSRRKSNVSERFADTSDTYAGSR